MVSRDHEYMSAHEIEKRLRKTLRKAERLRERLRAAREREGKLSIDPHVRCISSSHVISWPSSGRPSISPTRSELQQYSTSPTVKANGT